MDISALFPEYRGKFKGIVILGPPGCQKDSIIKKLSYLGNFFYGSFREIFEQLDQSSPLGKLCQKYINQGFPLPDEVIVTLWEQYINGSISVYSYHPQNQILILDWVPLNIHQAKLLDKSIEVVCVISLTLKRLSYSKEEAEKRKMQLYKQETLKILNYYPQSLIVSINADQKLLDVFKDILIAIQNKI